jgi:hypothetical protein
MNVLMNITKRPVVEEKPRHRKPAEWEDVVTVTGAPDEARHGHDDHHRQ